MGMAAASAWSQETVINSKSAEKLSDTANSFLNDPKRSINAGDYNAPRQLFGIPSGSLPMPQPIIINRDPSVNEALNKRKNWTLLTPEQILGIKTPEEILGIKDPANTKKLTLEEQFLLRQSRPFTGAVTNGRTGSLSGKDDANPFLRNKEDANPFSRGPFAQQNDQQSGSPKNLSQLFNSKVSDSFSGNDRNQESAWTSAFAQPSQPKMTPEQLANRERFRALMEPNSLPDSQANPARYGAPAAPAPDPYLQPQPKFNPAGSSYSTLQNNSTRPTGINPLPGVTRPAAKLETQRPSWQAQRPPWLTDGPQPHDPSRNF